MGARSVPGNNVCDECVVLFIYYINICKNKSAQKCNGLKYDRSV